MLVALSSLLFGSVSFRGRGGGIAFVAPGELDVFGLPMTVRWDVNGRRPWGFAVFVDREPVRPGQPLASLADDTCLRSPGCPNDDWYRQHGVLITRSRQTDVRSIFSVGGIAGTADHPVHRLTVVMVDADGSRRSEAYDSRELREP